MRLTQPVTEEVMVASWLKAEYDSERFSKPISRYLGRHAIDNSFITHPDLTDYEGNAWRRSLLQRNLSRGILKRFPWQSTRWLKLELESREEIGRLYTNPGMVWLSLTEGKRELAVAADFIVRVPKNKDPHSHVLGIQKRIGESDPLEPPILITASDSLDRPVGILEGHLRLVAYYLSDQTSFPLECIVGISPQIASWHHSEDTLESIRNNFMWHGKESA